MTAGELYFSCYYLSLAFPEGKVESKPNKQILKNNQKTKILLLKQKVAKPM